MDKEMLKAGNHAALCLVVVYSDENGKTKAETFYHLTEFAGFGEISAFQQSLEQLSERAWQAYLAALEDEPF